MQALLPVGPKVLIVAEIIDTVNKMELLEDIRADRGSLQSGHVRQALFFSQLFVCVGAGRWAIQSFPDVRPVLVPGNVQLLALR